MAVTEILSLLEISRKLLERKAELDKEYYELFIQPAWDLFVKIHNDYKVTYREYQDFVSSENYNVEMLIDKIRQDSIYKSDLRAELMKIMQHLPSAHFKTKEKYLLYFAMSIMNYFEVLKLTNNGTNNDEDRIIEFEDNDDDIEMYVGKTTSTRYGNRNVARIYTMIAISRKGMHDKAQVKTILDKAISKLQSRYELVADMHYQLRMALLT